MDNVELCRRVYTSFKELCDSGRQPSSFTAFCKSYGVSVSMVRRTLKGEFSPESLPKRGSMAKVYSKIYNDFKDLCENGQQPSTFAAFCRSRGVSFERMHLYLKDNGLSVMYLPGYKFCGKWGPKRHCQDIPFENVIFEEAGFLPADCGSVITVSVDGHIAVSFPANTDVATVAEFVRKMKKEGCYVGA